MPAAPPSPDIRSKRSRSSASAWATVLVFFGIDGCLSVVEGVSLSVIAEDWFGGFFEGSIDAMIQISELYLVNESYVR